MLASFLCKAIPPQLNCQSWIRTRIKYQDSHVKPTPVLSWLSLPPAQSRGSWESAEPIAAWLPTPCAWRSMRYGLTGFAVAVAFQLNARNYPVGTVFYKVCASGKIWPINVHFQNPTANWRDNRDGSLQGKGSSGERSWDGPGSQSRAFGCTCGSYADRAFQR